LTRSEKRQLLLDERADIQAFLVGLDAEAWSLESLCGGWTVLEVGAHLASFLGVTTRGLFLRGLRFGTSTRGANARSTAAWKAKGTSAITAGLGNPRRLGLGNVAPGWALTEAVVHHQDMRRPLGQMRAVPEERLHVALSVITRLPTGTGGSRRRRGVALEATDMEWSLGAGPVVQGPGEALLMTLAGRVAAVDELSGDGKEQLVRSLR
jgi:uncharacterized protein (TIGR03083 family)